MTQSMAIVSKASKSQYLPVPGRDWVERQLPVDEAINNGWRAALIRNVKPMYESVVLPCADVQLVYVLNGSVTFEFADSSKAAVIPGDCVHFKPRSAVRQIERSADCLLFELSATVSQLTDVASDRTVVHRAADIDYITHPLNPWMLRRPLGLRRHDLTVEVQLSRCVEVPTTPVSQTRTGLRVHLWFVLQGFCQLQLQGHSDRPFIPGDCVVLPANCQFSLVTCSDDFEVLEIACF